MGRRGWSRSPCVGPCSQCPRRGLLHKGHQRGTLGSHPHPHNLEALPSRSSGKAALLDCPACGQETVPWGGGTRAVQTCSLWEPPQCPLLKSSAPQFGWEPVLQKDNSVWCRSPHKRCPPRYKPSSHPDLCSGETPPSAQPAAQRGCRNGEAPAGLQSADRQGCSLRSPGWRLLWGISPALPTFRPAFLVQSHPVTGVATGLEACRGAPGDAPGPPSLEWRPQLGV